MLKRHVATLKRGGGERMAENVIDALLVTLGIDSSEYQQGMEEAERTTRDFSERAPREAERGLNRIEAKFGMTFKGIFRSFIAPLTAALGTMGVFSSYTQTADRIGKTAARIGASAEDLQAFGEAAKRSGGSVEGFIASFESLNGQIQRMQAMGGKGRLTPLLKQLGISPTENGRAKDTFRILRDLAEASERVGKEKFAGTARFFGLDSGTIALLQQGRVAMDELIKRQKDLGVYTKQDFEITAKFNDSLSDLQQTFRMLAAPILRVITPALSTLAGWLTKIGQTFREHQGFIVAGLVVIAATMSGVLLKAAVALGAALAPLLAPIAAIAALGAIFDEIAVYAEGGETAFEGLWRAIGTPEQFMAVGKAIQDGLGSAWEEIKSALATAGEYLAKFGSALSPLIDAVAPVVDAFKSVLSTGGELLAWSAEFAAWLARLVLPIEEIFSPGEPSDGWSVLKKIAEACSLAFQSLAYVLKEVSDWLGGLVSDARQALSALDFLTPLKKLAEEIAGFFNGLFHPGTPGSEWNLLQSIIDSVKSAVDMLLNSVKTVFAWIMKVLNAVNAWWNGTDGMVAQEQKTAAKNAVLGGQTEEEYINKQAAQIVKANPQMNVEDAKQAARKNLQHDTELRRDYDLFGGDLFSLEQLGYNVNEINAMIQGMNKTPVATQKADAAQISQDFRKTSNVTVNNDTRIEQNITGTPAEVVNRVGDATQQAVERGNAGFLPAVDTGVF